MTRFAITTGMAAALILAAGSTGAQVARSGYAAFVAHHGSGGRGGTRL